MAHPIKFSSDLIHNALTLSGLQGGCNRLDETVAADSPQRALVDLLSDVCDGWMLHAGAQATAGIRGYAIPELVSHQMEHIQGADLNNAWHTLKFSFGRHIHDYDIIDKSSVLQAAADWGYLEVRAGDQVGEIIISGSRVDPLKSEHRIADHSEWLRRRPTPGDSQTGWEIGITRNQGVLVDKWDQEEPHLLIAGSSGSGKSNIRDLMLLQMMHNNSPDDLHVWMLEPKHELQAYSKAAHVKRMVDTQTPNGNLWADASALFCDAVIEMERRYAIMASHPGKPHNMADCQAFTQSDPEANASLNFPMILIVVEESSSYFAKPSSEKYRSERDSLVVYAETIARKGRATGIHMVFLTQHPVVPSLPTAIKLQCRRIGLKTPDMISSRAIIERGGLERITEQGQGIALIDSEHREFKAFHLSQENLTASIDALPRQATDG